MMPVEDFDYIREFCKENGWGVLTASPNDGCDLSDLIPDDEWEYNPDTESHEPTQIGLEMFECWRWADLAESLETPPLKIRWRGETEDWVAELLSFNCVVHTVRVPSSGEVYKVCECKASYFFDRW
jgi:hypothetical protein|tara:strand:- start:981 stop:1358 length:378 start_codon:yes stop_codon:yes gene_type:complete